MPSTRIDILRDIVAKHQAAKVNWIDFDGKSRRILVDAFTASIVLQIHDALSQPNQAKLLAFPWPRMVDTCFKLAKWS